MLEGEGAGMAEQRIAVVVFREHVADGAVEGGHLAFAGEDGGEEADARGCVGEQRAELEVARRGGGIGEGAEGLTADFLVLVT